MAEESNYPHILLEDLLGHSLNNIESKFATKTIYYKGSMKIPLPSPRVSIIGSRMASENGLAEAEKISRFLIENKITIVSGLAKGIDTIGHKTAIKHGGKTIAVIGTPLNRVYPKENYKLQSEIMKNHLAISQYPTNHTTVPKDFALRNKTMALISDATVIIEAKDSSGSLYNGWEMLRLGRPLFICKTITENKILEWPQKMINHGAMILEDMIDILEHLPSDAKMPGNA